MRKRGLTCLDCKHCFVEDLYYQLCCDIKNPSFRYELIPVNKYGNPYSKCKKFEKHNL